ncbi:hypothetical protein MBLNU230_g7485t1 [Neophaeotheca triangularis]
MQPSTMTPIRIRGKRTAVAGEKWHAGRKRIDLRTRDDDPVRSVPSSSQKDGSAPPHAKRRRIHTSKIESLPTEIVQEIFQLSRNVDMPCASLALRNKLSSAAMYRQMAISILRAVCRLPLQGSAFNSQDIRDANRLFACRFMTHAFFRNIAESLLTIAPSSDEGQNSLLPTDEWSTDKVWLTLHPYKELLPPLKLLRGPFHGDKIDYLKALWTQPLDHNSSRYATACEGLSEAVSEGATPVATHFLQLGVRPDHDLLRTAVTKPQCSAQLVAQMLYIDMKKSREANEHPSFDCLDPMIWSWAGDAELEGDVKATQCMEMLRYTADCAGMRLPLRAFMRRFMHFLQEIESLTPTTDAASD